MMLNIFNCIFTRCIVAEVYNSFDPKKDVQFDNEGIQ
jgi:hypothetical protein